MGLTESITAFVCTLYAHVLGRMGVQPDDDFFADLNGDSLAAAQVIVVLEDLLQINVIESFFEDSRPAAIAPILAEHVHSHAAAGRSWPDGSSLIGDALREEFARLSEWLPPSQVKAGSGPASFTCQGQAEPLAASSQPKPAEYYDALLDRRGVVLDPCRAGRRRVRLGALHRADGG